MCDLLIETGIMIIALYVYMYHFWANYNNSLTWNVGPFWHDSPYQPWFQASGEQWGRYNYGLQEAGFRTFKHATGTISEVMKWRFPKTGGTPKSSVSIRFFIMNNPFWFWKHPNSLWLCQTSTLFLLGYTGIRHGGHNRKSWPSSPENISAIMIAYQIFGFLDKYSNPLGV